MKKILFRLISLTLTVMLCLTALSGCKSKQTLKKINLPKYNSGKFSSDYSESGIAAENEYLELIWDNSKKLVSFRDKKTGNLWGQIPEEALNSGAVLTNALKSALYVYYKDSSNLGEKYAYSSEGAVRDGDVHVNKIENGISVTYNFLDYQFSVTLDYVLDGNKFSVIADPRKMSDDGVNYITGISVMPFICSAANDTKTDWLLLPDGEGSVIYPKTISQMGVEGSAKVYGEDLSVRQFNYKSLTEQVNMPVFGVARETGGLFANISSGAEQSVICWNMGSSAVGYSGVYPRYRLRGYSLIKTPNNFGWTSLNYIKMFDESVTETPFRVDYTLLDGENNTVTGMAEIYRDYLKKTHKLTKSSVSETVANYKFLGAMENSTFFLGIPTTEVVPLTTAKDVEKITSDIKSQIGNDFSVNLVGFGKTGVDVGEIGGGFTVSGKLGGKTGLKNLGEYFKNAGIKGYFDFDIISFSKSGSGFSYNSDGAILTNGPAAVFNSFNSVGHGEIEKNYHILSRNLLAKAATKVIDRKDMLSGMGVSFAGLSNTVYSDYGYNSFRNCKSMSGDVKSILSAVKKNKMAVSSAKANDYAACVSDVLTDCPISSSRYDFESYSVPFYQAVFKGYKPLSSVSLNLTSEENEALLSCVESGTTPSYTIINNYDNDFINSHYSFIYGSVYSDRKDGFTDGVKSTSKYFESIKGATIKNHTVINKDVRITRFSNGVYSVVNYGDTEYQSEYGKVEPKSFITGSEV